MTATSASLAAQGAIARYQQVIAQLYTLVEAAVTDPGSERGGGVITEDALNARGAALVEASAQVRESLVSQITPENGERSQLASLQLVAAAAADLALADQLLRQAPQTETGGTQEFAERGGDGAWAALSSDELLQDLRDVLNAPLDAGFGPLLDGERGATPSTSDPKQAREDLTKTVKDFLSVIPGGAAEVGQHALTSTVTAGIDPLKNAASLAGGAILGALPAGLSLFLSHAAQLAAEAVQKLLDALGPQLTDAARDEVNSWMKDLKESDGIATSLLKRLYETSRIGDEVNGQIADAPDDRPAPFNAANGELQDLEARYDKTRKVLQGALHIVDLAHTTLIATGPWGVAAVYSSYAVILGYAVYTGGDYLDWYRTGDIAWLDRVVGLRAVIREALPTSPVSATPAPASAGSATKET